MLTTGVGVVFYPFGLDLLGGQLAILAGQGQHAVANMLDGACFMGVDVARNSAENCLMGTQRCADNS